MEKFTQKLNESTIYDSPLTKSEHRNYQKFIRKTIKEMYPERLVVLPGGMVVYKAFDYEKGMMPGREFSIISKVDSNIKLLKAIWEFFEINDYNHLVNLISKFKKDFFSPEGRFFKSKSRFSIWDIIRITEEAGEKNEDFVCQCIALTWEGSNPVREVTSSHKDMILGIDITFNIDGVEKTCQVKPLVTDNFRERGVVIIETNGLMKEYDTDYIAFVNPKRSFRQPCLMFKNKMS